MNLKQLATHLGLSPATVSRVLSATGKPHRIGEATQERVRAAARELGVTANHHARGLRLQASHTLAFVVPDISNPFFAALCRQVEQTARLRGYTVLVADSQEDAGVETEVLERMLARNVDGMILAPVAGEGPQLVALRARLGALVLVDRVDPGVRVPAVVLDNFAAAAAAVGLLHRAGHERVACLQGEPHSVANRERVAGFRAAMRRRQPQLPDEWVVGTDYSVESGRRGMSELIRLAPRPTAVVALGNLLALGALEALRAARLSVPGDVSLVSFDEQPWSAALSPPLTTIGQPVETLAAEAIRLLFAQLDRPGSRLKPARVVVPFTVIRRESVARPRPPRHR